MAEQDVSKRIVVRIYVAEHCQACEHTYQVAESIRAHFPQVELHIVDLATTQETIPEEVFATPTYLLNGRVWSLGNPSPEEIATRLGQAVQALTSEGSSSPRPHRRDEEDTAWHR